MRAYESISPSLCIVNIQGLLVLGILKKLLCDIGLYIYLSSKNIVAWGSAWHY